jgi:hypothetical protein
MWGCGKTLLAVVANRKRCRSAFWRNPTANTALAVCCAAAQFFISHLRAFASIRG